MTIMQAISRIDEMKPNAYAQENKVDWLSTLDGMVKKQVIDHYEGSEDVEFNGYDKETDKNTVLLIPEPFTDVYVHWLESKIDYFDGEYNKYNNDAMQFNDMYSQYRNWYNSTHNAKGVQINYF